MDNEKLESIVENEKEWRKEIWKKVDRIEQNQIKIDKILYGYKIKFAALALTCGVAGAKVLKLLNL